MTKRKMDTCLNCGDFCILDYPTKKLCKKCYSKLLYKKQKQKKNSKDKDIKIGITHGMRGIFPVMYDDEGPIQTGFTCKNHKQATNAAIQWAKDEFGENWKEHCDYKDIAI